MDPPQVIFVYLAGLILFWLAIKLAGISCLAAYIVLNPPKSYQPHQKEKVMTNQAVPHKINLEMVTPIHEEKEHNWTFELEGVATVVTEDGNAVTGKVVRVDHFGASAFYSPYGRRESGVRPEGYVAWMFREGPKAGVHGSAVNVVFSVDPNGQIWIGGHLRKRANIEGGTLETFDLGGGFTNPNDKSPVATALRESLEEQGVVIKPITGANLAPGIWNRLFQYVPRGGGNTISFIPSLVEWDSLVEAGNGRMGFKNPQIDLSTLDADEDTKAKALKQAENAAKMVFVPAIEIMARVQDNIVVTGAARVFSAHQLGLLSPYADLS